MADPQFFDLARRQYRQCYKAEVSPAFDHWRARALSDVHGALLGWRSAADGPLFLEAYLDRPVDQLISAAWQRPVRRDQIVEIGNFAADNCMAMVQLWAETARSLSSEGAIAVATLTAPLRRMFTRIGMPLTRLASADPARLGPEARHWGSYYGQDPHICAGAIADGERALNRFLQRPQAAQQETA